MKKYVLGIMLFVLVEEVPAQKSSSSILASKMQKSILSNSDISKGLKEALRIGIQNTGKQLSAVNGFYNDALVKIVLPPEAAIVATNLQKIGLGYLVDSVVLSMNRAAEQAAIQITPVFLTAIQKISFQDAVQILNGSEQAATDYLKASTSDSLKVAITPIISTSLQQTKAEDAWNTVFKTYNKIPFTQKVNPNLTSYVTDQTLKAVFLKLAIEEKAIRTNAAARTTSILKTVFGTK
jgi:hypothetical protein